MEFKEYQHIEKWGKEEVEGIELGTCYVFPKIDGTNASIWMDEGSIQTGSRTRWLANGQNDNAGFRYAVANEIQFNGIRAYLKENPFTRFYGEWLVPHTLKTYRQDVWKKFYVFDVTILMLNEDGTSYEKYLSYEEYKTICDLHGINYIPCIEIIRNGTYENFISISQKNDYLIKAGKGTGEGIVIKNYDYKNKWGRQTWAKIVTSEFKEQHYKEMGPPEHNNKLIEDAIVTEYCTLTLVEKTIAKIVNAENNWSSKMIPRLIETVYHDMIVEEIYEILKKFKSPTINFKTLHGLTTQRIKQLRQDLF